MSRDGRTPTPLLPSIIQRDDASCAAPLRKFAEFGVRNDFAGVSDSPATRRGPNVENTLRSRCDSGPADLW